MTRLSARTLDEDGRVPSRASEIGRSYCILIDAKISAAFKNVYNLIEYFLTYDDSNASKGSVFPKIKNLGFFLALKSS